MRERHIRVARTARYYMLGSAGPHLREVWLACHGYRQLAGRFLSRFADLDDPAVADEDCLGDTFRSIHREDAAVHQQQIFSARANRLVSAAARRRRQGQRQGDTGHPAEPNRSPH